MMTMLDVLDRIEQGSYRSDRFPAVPFVTFEDVLKTASKPQSICGASLTTGESTHYCMLTPGHMAVSQHDWVDLL